MTERPHPQIDLICLPQLVITEESPAVHSSRSALASHQADCSRSVKHKFDQLEER